MPKTPRKPRKLVTPTQLHILMALAEADRHGYAIKTAVEERTDGALNLGPATLYDAIHRLVQSKWIEEVARSDDDPAPGSPRRYYRITPAGNREMTTELARLASIVDGARSEGILPETKQT